MSRGQSRIYDTGFSVAEPRDEVTVCVDDRGDLKSALVAVLGDGE